MVGREHNATDHVVLLKRTGAPLCVMSKIRQLRDRAKLSYAANGSCSSRRLRRETTIRCLCIDQARLCWL